MLDPLDSNVTAYDDKYMENVYRMKMCNAFPSKKTKTQCTRLHTLGTHTYAHIHTRYRMKRQHSFSNWVLLKRFIGMLLNILTFFFNP